MYDWQVLGTFHVDTYNHFLRVSVLGHVLVIVSFSPPKDNDSNLKYK